MIVHCTCNYTRTSPAGLGAPPGYFGNAWNWVVNHRPLFLSTLYWRCFLFFISVPRTFRKATNSKLHYRKRFHCCTCGWTCAVKLWEHTGHASRSLCWSEVASVTMSCLLLIIIRARWVCDYFFGAGFHQISKILSTATVETCRSPL